MFARWFVLLWVVCLCAGSFAKSESAVTLKLTVDGLSQPLFVTEPPDASGRLFIVEKGGRIRIFRNGSLLSEPFLDLSARVTNLFEMGLLGLAFHPRFAENRRFFVNFTTEIGGPRRTVIAEFRALLNDADRSDPASERLLLSFEQPAGNHNGGMMAFGEDGYLYIATGDGGGANDSFGNGQNLETLLGAILRIDVDSGNPYGIPPDNPFVDTPVARPEIWAYGLRNPWRFSFDRFTGQLFAGDVGQSRWEEIDLIQRGDNCGWNEMEGAHCFPTGSGCDLSQFRLPISEYGRDGGSSVTGGYVYRGTQAGPLWGQYLFGDFVSGRIWSLGLKPGRVWERKLLLDTALSISSFGEDQAGELYVVDLGGAVYRLLFGSRLRLAQFADGAAPEGRLTSTLILLNPGNRPAEGTARLHHRSGDARPVALDGSVGTEFPFELQPGTSVSLRTPGSADPPWVGWAEVEADAPLEALVLYTFWSSTGAPVAEAGLADSTPGSVFTTFVSQDRIQGVETGFALANPGSEQVQVTISVLADSGPVAETAFVLGAGRQTAEFLSERFPLLPSEFQGTARITSSADIVMTLLRTRWGLPFSSLPVSSGGSAAVE